MTKQVRIDLCGLVIWADVEYEDGAVCGVQRVYAEMPNGHLVALKCSISDFYKSLDGELQEALEEELKTDYIAHCEMQMDARKESR